MRGGGTTPNRGESIARVRAFPQRGYRAARRMVRCGCGGREAYADPVVESATDHAAADRHRAVLRTPLRAPVGSVCSAPRLQPVQLQRRIERAMEAERLAASDRTLVPNRFVVRLHPTISRASPTWSTTLAAELADAALVFARAHHYTLVDRPRVDLLADATVDRADIRVDARFADPIAGRTSPGGPTSDRARDAEREPRRLAPRWSSRCRVPTAPSRPAARARPDGERPRGPDRRRPDHRPRHRQRPRPARRAGLAPPRPDRRPARDAASTPTSAAPTAPR